MCKSSKRHLVMFVYFFLSKKELNVYITHSNEQYAAQSICLNQIIFFLHLNPSYCCFQLFFLMDWIYYMKKLLYLHYYATHDFWDDLKCIFFFIKVDKSKHQTPPIIFIHIKIERKTKQSKRNRTLFDMYKYTKRIIAFTWNSFMTQFNQMQTANTQY